MSSELITKDVAKALISKWKRVLDFTNDQVKPITESHRRLSTAMLLENQSRWINETVAGGSGSVFGTAAGAGTTYNNGFSGDTYAPQDARLPKILIPMIRRTFPELITNEVVGVQPMSGPVGLAFALRYVYDANPLNQLGTSPQQRDGFPSASPEAWWNKADGKEAGYNNMYADYTGVSTNQFDWATISANASGSQISSLPASALNVVGNIINDQDKGIARLMSQFEMTGRIPQMSIKLEKTVVEAGTRRIAASWSTELEQDLKAMNGIDIDNEMVNSLSYEVQAEIDREMLTRMMKICLEAGFASPAKGKGFSFWNAATSDARWIGERARDLYARIIVESNRIAIYNRRGPANFIIATPRVCSLLEMLPDLKYNPVGSSVNTQPTGIAKVGTIGGRFNVYRDTRTEAQYDMGDREEAVEYALLGYKGADFYDTGIVFCPYIPVMIQRTIGPNDFAPRVGMMTRYGVVDHIFGSDLFYHLIVVTGLSTEVSNPYVGQRVIL